MQHLLELPQGTPLIPFPHLLQLPPRPGKLLLYSRIPLPKHAKLLLLPIQSEVLPEPMQLLPQKQILLLQVHVVL